MKSQIAHYDLFAGIGGFSLALDNIYGKQNTKHIFVERDDFCQLVLKKHWPDAEYWGDINQFIAHAKYTRESRTEEVGKDSRTQQESEARAQLSFDESEGNDCLWKEKTGRQHTILTGGFPCQPFSQAGRRRGTADDRYLWPAMLGSIKLIRPHWVIAENVAGLVTWSEGLVLEQVCSDLESEGYEVQPFIIPAVAVNAPHRRDRVWIVANINRERQSRNWQGGSQIKGRFGLQDRERHGKGRDSWKRNWVEVAASLCRVDDGLSRRLDRNPRLKALGNAIVPQVAEEIFKQILTINL